MTGVEAEQCYNEFIDVWNSFNHDEVYVYELDDLPSSIGKYKYAHFVLADNLITKRVLTKKIGDQLIESYGWVSAYFDYQNAEDINSKYLKRKRDDDTALEWLSIHRPIVEKALSATIEFNNFLAERLNNIKIRA